MKEEKIHYKRLLKQYAEKIIADRIATTRQAMDEAQAAANQEEKSSAGDKYETARAMGHLQKDMHARQLVAHQQELSALRAVNVDILYEKPATGAVVRSSKAQFFIGVGLGKQLIDGGLIIFLSPAAPLAQQLMSKKLGDEFEFNGRDQIMETY